MEKFYIENVKINDDNIMSIILSSNKHYECIIIHGSRDEATNRMIKILTALNGD